MIQLVVVQQILRWETNSLPTQLRVPPGVVVLFGLPLPGAAAGIPRWFPWRKGLAPPLPFRRGSGALPYPGRGGHPPVGCGLSTASSVGGVVVVRRLVSLQTPRSTPVHLPRLLRFYVHAFAHSNFSPIPCVARSPLVEAELKEEETNSLPTKDLL